MTGNPAEVMPLLLTTRFDAVFNLISGCLKLTESNSADLIRSLDQKLPIFFCSGAVTEGDKKAAFDAVLKAILESPLTRKNSPLPLRAAVNIQST